MDLGIKKAVGNGQGSTIIYTALLGAALAQFLPNPGDALFFYLQEKNTDKLNNGEITPKQFWVRDVAGYYGFSAGYYTLVLLTVASIGGSYKTKARILAGLVAGGLVIGVVAKNIQKDTLQQKQKNKVS